MVVLLSASISRLLRLVVFSSFVCPLIASSAVGEELGQSSNPLPVSSPSAVIEIRPGWYLTAGAGVLWQGDLDDTRTSSTYSHRLGHEIYQNRNGRLSSTPGLSLEGGIGYDFGNRIRAELTYLYASSSLGLEQYSGTITYPRGDDSFTGAANVSGTVSKNSIFASAYYDIPTKARFVPYLGAGIGWSKVSASDMMFNYDVALNSGGRSKGSSLVPGGSSSAFAYQAKIGVSYLVSQNADLFVEAVYSGNTSVNLSAGSTFADFNSYGARAGFRYRFSR